MKPCRCKLCRQLDDDNDPGPPNTVVQAAYVQAFIDWFRAADPGRLDIEEDLARLAVLVKHEALRTFPPNRADDPPPGG